MTVSRRATLLGLTAAAFITAPAMAAPSSTLIEQHWQQAGSAGDVDHSAWGSFLSRYVSTGPSGVNLVNYGGVTPRATNRR